MENRYYVYTYSYPDGTPFYVGKGCGKRYLIHLREAELERNLNSWNIRVINKLLRHDEEPIIEKVIENIDEELALFIEEEMIAKYGRRSNGTGILTNHMPGGAPSGPPINRVMDDEYKSKISRGLKAYYAKYPVSEERKQHLRDILSGENSPFYGKTHSKEAIEKIRKANIGKKQKPEAIEKMRQALKILHSGKNNPFYGKTHDEEARKKMSKASRATIKKLKTEGKDHFNKGKKASTETLEKLRIKRTCPHCGKEGGGSAMNRYHFDNCKNKVV